MKLHYRVIKKLLKEYDPYSKKFDHNSKKFDLYSS